MEQLYITPSAVTDLQSALADRHIGHGNATRSAHCPMGSNVYHDGELIDLTQFVRLLEQESAPRKRPDLGWRTGLASDYGNRGDVGRAVLGARNLGTALQRLVQYFPLIQDATLLSLEIEENWASLNYKILDPDIWPRHQDAMYSLGIYARLIRMTAPQDWHHVEVSVECEGADICADLSNIVGTQVSYGAHSNSLRFPTAWLGLDVAILEAAAPTLLQSLSRQLAQKRRTISMTQRTKNVIYRELGLGCVGQDSIAAELGMTSRTLRRKLATEGWSFQQLLDDCRMRYAAREMKTRLDLSLSELALKLGYSEHSTFSRAFSRWAGTAPQNYRQQLLLH